MTDIEFTTEQRLYERVSTILDEARGRVARTVNTAMVHAYWRIGREIVEVEQRGSERARYGEQIIERLAKRLTKRFGRGVSVTTLQRARAFFAAYPKG
jgi:hypothetical protein